MLSIFKYISLVLSVALAGAGGVAVTSPSLQFETNTSLQSQVDTNKNVENSDLFVSSLQGNLRANVETDVNAQLQENIKIDSHGDINIHSEEDGNTEENNVTEASYQSNTQLIVL